MRNLLLIAGAAAMAVSMPALAEKGGKGGGNGGGKPAAAQGGGGKAHKAHNGGGGGQAAKPQNAQRQSFAGGGQRAKQQKAELGGFGSAKPQKAQRQASRATGADRGFKAQRKAVKEVARRRERAIDRRFDDRGSWSGATAYNDAHIRNVGISDSCPPGLAKKGNGCLPPGQAKKIFAVGDRIQPAWFSGYRMPADYSSLYHDTDDYYYRYDDDGYIYRIDRSSDLISGLVPLLGGGFAVGQPLPAGYDVYNLPVQYRDDYYDTDEYSYRYGDDAIYRVDQESGIIESIVALLAGDLNVGEALPAGYDMYNVPMDYRDQYQDSDEHMYRYADGNIYEVDTKTQIIQAIVEMLA
jgi:hypothetical protein